MRLVDKIIQKTKVLNIVNLLNNLKIKRINDFSPIIEEKVPIINIACWGIASQSSLSQWSKPNDAQRAVDESLDIDSFAFHTSKENNPWWQLELNENITYQKIRIWNRKNTCQDKANGLILEYFDTNQSQWILLMNNILFEKEFVELYLGLQGPLKIRLKLNKIEYLHLAKVEVLINQKDFLDILHKNDKYVLCRPQGGLNDNLVQVTKCYFYAKKYKRFLVIDGETSSFLDNWSNYFIPLENIKFSDFSELGSPDDIYPGFIANRLNSYRIKYVGSDLKYVDTQNNKPVTFDFSAQYKHKFLLHHAGGGGVISYKIFNQLILKKEIIDEFKEIYSKLGQYAAIHIRNTDYKTDYEGFLINFPKEKYHKIIVCTDDSRCKEFAKKIFLDKFVNVTQIPNNNGERIHNNKKYVNYQLNKTVVLDLLFLAASTDLFILQLTGGGYSGFSMLAKKLNENKNILNKFLMN